MKMWLILILLSLMVAFMPTVAQAGHGWLVYYEGGFRGKVIDAETKRPIEGAVVVAVYHIECLGLGHGGSVTLGAKETLTDRSGEFHLLPNIGFSILPWCVGGNTTFVIYKPGYAAVPQLNLEDILSKDTGGEVKLPWLKNADLKFLFAPRLIGLPKVKTKEERKQAWMDANMFDDHVREKDLPFLNKSVNDESKNWR